MRRTRQWLVLAMAGLQLGCGAGWRRVSPLPDSSIDPNQQIQVWQKGKAQRWHGVRIGADSVTGLAFMVPLTCDSCRRAIPRAQVDSLRFGSPPAGFWKSIGLFMGTYLALICLAFCGYSGD
jgi:hypothetical protein